ncbi:hypothetical protein TNCV_1855411 [Trichonephila clavipes]|nr:hypothetical protein TNCV_1855411 [Trichonephila clavipes]
MVDKDIWIQTFWSLFKAQNIIDADYGNEKEMNNAAPVPTSSDMRNVMKRPAGTHSHRCIPPLYSFLANISTLEPQSPFGPDSFDPSQTALPIIIISYSQGYSLHGF